MTSRDMFLSALRDAAQAAPTPAVLYDLAGIDTMVAELRRDLSELPDVLICFAVKANRCPDVLRHLASLGLGADVASPAELELAMAAGMKVVTATAPALSGSELADFHKRGVLLDVSSVSQLRVLLDEVGSGVRLGLRVRVPVSPADRKGKGIEWSRFGVDPADPELHELLRCHRVEVTRLHVHAGEVMTARRARRLVTALLACADQFPEVTTLNLGGGLAALYARPAEARQAWAEVAAVLAEHRGRRFRIVVEPGMLLTALAGYLVVSVRAVDRHPTGHQVATVDASGWNLLSWTSPRLVAQIPHRPDDPRTYTVAGASCYEEDYVARSIQAADLRVGDRLIFNAAGAYVTSMARSMHGLALPYEAALVQGSTTKC
ncbi:diaminopimelate decarboxylase family protein [Nonomuraea jabiensis]|uniref:Diaminopimelate decarboxylase n=1 Tax=Nonomuraea jabiensis TaxID=882448 RepID=A0A7W9FXV4_9ACTN|nr:hypothetical protein [Nonomuraea jabiensis]MBB5773565.1 diaminopimelate decarboxylase [Nonomuraea jabiensis]